MRVKSRIAGYSQTLPTGAHPVRLTPAVRAILHGPQVQPKLTIGAVDDPAEHEADRVADQVMRMAEPAADGGMALGGSTRAQGDALQRKCACGGSTGPSGECAECAAEREVTLQRRAADQTGADAVAPLVHEILRAPGQPLDHETRAFMEPRFGRDFGQVRVHADARASESARSVKADAYTVGRNVVFGSGRYEPASAQGRHLLAHELTHVMQQGSDVSRPAGSAGTGVVQRQDTTHKETLKPGEKPKVEEKPKEDTAAALVDDIVKLLSPVTDDADFVLKHTLVEKQLANPKTFENLPKETRKKVPAAVKPLYEAAMIERIKKFPGSATAVVDKLFTGLKATTKVDYAKEMEKLPTSPSNIKGSVEDVMEYVLLRAEFGSFENITKYYADVRGYSFLGRSPTVHKTLGEKLAKAEQVLKDNKWLDIAKSAVREIGGFNIRPNTNNPSVLSDHSFGWAIDINAAMNPNVKDFPAGLVRGLTGVSMFEGSESAAFQTDPNRGTAESLLPQAQTLKQASTTLQTAFTDEASLRSGLITYLKDRLGATFEDKDFDFSLVKNIVEGRKAADAAKKALEQFQKARKKKKVKKGEDTSADDKKEKELSTASDTAAKTLETRITALGDFLAKAKLDVTKASAEQEEERKEELVDEKEQGLRNEEAQKKKAAQDLEKAKKKKGYVAPPEPTAAEKKTAEEKQAQAVRDKVSEFLITAYKVYLSTFKSDQKRVAAAISGTTATIAVHGFLDLAPELIAALTGSDGGGLHWLGATKGTKDFMHFELEHADRPPKVVAATEKSEGKPETPTPKPEDKKIPASKAIQE